MQDCVFCKIAKGELSARFEWKGKNVIAFRDINPIAPVHVLVIPRRHIKSLSEVKSGDKDILGEIQVVTARVARKVGISQAFRLLTASGAKAGQTVFHLHYHLIGGWGKKTPGMEVKQDNFRRG